MHSKTVRTALAALALAAGAALALAQNPGGYSNAPTDKDYRMTVIQPAEGATIRGTDVAIELRLPRVPEGTGVSEAERRDTLTPTFQIFVDGQSVGNLPQGQNVFTARELSEGPHKIVVVAKNTAGEVVDRKEINVTTTAVTGSAEASAPARATEPSPAGGVEPAPASAVSAAPSTATTLPQTGSSYPAVALAGLGLLLAGGVLVRRS